MTANPTLVSRQKITCNQGASIDDDAMPFHQSAEIDRQFRPPADQRLRVVCCRTESHDRHVDVLLRSVGPRDGQGRTAQKPRCAILEQGDGSDHTY